jgi:RNA polymerase sigma factor (sigma-70 family)
MSSDEALILEFKAGSREAFEQLFDRYRQPIHGFFRRRLASPERAEDLTQELFLAVIRGSSRYEPRASVRSYLFGIAFKLLFAERRKQSHGTPPEDPAFLSDSTDALWVREALEKLDPYEREILMLREYEQLSYAEIAHLLRLPVNTVRSRLFRSRMALKRHLEPVEKS